MASSSRPKRVRYTFDVHFASQEEKDAFLRRLKGVRQKLTPPGSPPLDNCSLFSSLCDAIEADSPSTSAPVDEAASKSFMKNSGEFPSIMDCLCHSIMAIVTVWPIL